MITTTALEFLEFSAGETDAQAVIDRFLHDITAFGFSSAAGGAWVGVGAARAHRFYFNNWPKAWFELYQASGFVVNDPLLLETRRKMTPFLWTEMRQTHSFTVEGQAVITAVEAYGWREVMGVPFHGPAGYQGLVAMAAMRPVAMSAVERDLLRAMAVAVHDRAHQAIGLGQATLPPINLTRRETECMHWVAGGKTNSEIAVIIGIAPATVHYHVESAKKKLGAHTRSAAIGLLVLAGAI